MSAGGNEGGFGAVLSVTIKACFPENHGIKNQREFLAFKALGTKEKISYNSFISNRLDCDVRSATHKLLRFRISDDMDRVGYLYGDFLMGIETTLSRINPANITFNIDSVGILVALAAAPLSATAAHFWGRVGVPEACVDTFFGEIYAGASVAIAYIKNDELPKNIRLAFYGIATAVGLGFSTAAALDARLNATTPCVPATSLYQPTKAGGCGLE